MPASIEPGPLGRDCAARMVREAERAALWNERIATEFGRREIEKQLR